MLPRGVLGSAVAVARHFDAELAVANVQAPPLTRGDPAAQLLAITLRDPVDLIVIGRSGRNAEAPLGSVTRHLARVAPM